MGRVPLREACKHRLDIFPLAQGIPGKKNRNGLAAVATGKAYAIAANPSDCIKHPNCSVDAGKLLANSGKTIHWNPEGKLPIINDRIPAIGGQVGRTPTAHVASYPVDFASGQ